MVRKKLTNQPPKRKTNNKTDANTTDAIPEVISVPHVPHSIIALSVLISLIGSLAVNLDASPRGWLSVIGSLVTLAGGVIYLGFARKIEGRKRIWTHVLVVMIFLGLIYGFNALVQSRRSSSVIIINPTPSPTATPEPTPTPELPDAFSVVINGRVALLPEYFDRRSERKDLTAAQIQSMNNDLVDKWIWFRGEIEEASYRPKQKDMWLKLKRGEQWDIIFVADKEQMLKAERLGKSPASLLCIIKRSTADTLMFTDCEVNP